MTNRAHSYPQALARRRCRGLEVVLASVLAGCCEQSEGRQHAHEHLTPGGGILAQSSYSQERHISARAGHQFAWLLYQINHNRGRISEGDVNERFHESYVMRNSARNTAAIIADFSENHAPVAVFNVEWRQPERLLVHAKTARGNVRIRLSVEESSGRITGLRIVPYLSLEEITSDVSSLAPQAQMLIAEIHGQECQALFQVNSDESFPVGSTFKLYVLLSLVDHILAGRATWESEISIRDEWKSLPFGTMQDEPAGTRHSLYSFAEGMISISDNTATDHIIYTLGRQTVEAAWVLARHHQPSLNVPLLSTREFFLFHLALSPSETGQYLEWDEVRRREYLDRTLAGRRATRAPDVNKAVSYHPASIQWFASAVDLCNVMATLSDRARSHVAAAPVLAILAKQPGVSLPPEIWPYVGHKAGWWRGSRNVSWLLRRDDGRLFFVTLGLADPSGAEIDKARMFAVAHAIIELLADEER